MGIYRRGKYWYIDYYKKGRKRVKESVGRVDVLNRRNVEDILKKRKLDIVQDKWLDIKNKVRVSLEEMGKMFYEKHSLCNKKSHRRDKILIEHLTKFFKGKYLDEIDPSHIEEYRATRKAEFFNEHNEKKNIALATLNREVACLKAIYNKAVIWGKFGGENPVKKVKLYKENNIRMRFLSKAEIKQLICCCAPHIRRIVIFALCTGMRISEITALKWRDIDFNSNIIYIRDSKSGYGRQIPLNFTLKKLLLNDKIKCERAEDSYVFPNKEYKRIKSIRTGFKAACRRAGIDDFRTHDLRHTAASYLVMSGCDLTTVKEILGHKDITTTLRYAHLNQPHKAKAMENLGNVVPIWSQLTEGKKNLEGKNRKKRCE